MPFGTDNVETQILVPPEELVNTEQARKAIAFEDKAAAAASAEAIPLPSQSKPATFAKMQGMDRKAEM